jgi:hypothetical protein
MIFDEFWKLYPRKVSKRVAQKMWERMTKDEQQAAVEALPVHIKYWRLKETDADFIPHAATWLNQGRWEDELDLKEKKPPALPWYSDEQLTMAKAREVGVNPLPGESFSELRKRISNKVRELA